MKREWCIATFCVVAATGAAHGSVYYETLYDFSENKGANPQAGLIVDGVGALYGTTSAGGGDGVGTAFRLTRPSTGQTAWTYSTLYTFSSDKGASPHAGLIFDAAGALYGTTYAGGSDGDGTVFRLTPPALGKTAWTYSTLYTFSINKGANPQAGLIVDGAGALYGTTSAGGNEGDGTVFKLTPPAAGQTAWTYSTLYTFSSSKGANPHAGLIFDPAGALYGTTSAGGGDGVGTAFRLTPPPAGQTAWTYSTLYTFSLNKGARPQAGLIFDKAGALYGTTSTGGGDGVGTAFRLTPPPAGQTAWTYSTLYTFSLNKGASPQAGLIFDKAGALYGTTSAGGSDGYGVLFRLTPPAAGETAWTYSTLYTYAGSKGADSHAGLIFDAAGALYGTTYAGGSADQGVAFELPGP